MGGVLELGQLCGQINRGSGRGICQSRAVLTEKETLLPQVRLIFTLAILNKKVSHPGVSLLPLSAMLIHDRHFGAAGVTTVLDRESLTLVFHRRDRGS